MKNVFFGSLLAAFLAAPAARADDAKGGGGFLLYSLGICVPGEIGLDRAVASDAQPRLRIGWVYQIPLGMFAFHQSDADWMLEASPLWQHRIVFSFSFLYGTDGQGAARSFRYEAADLRGGYRYRFRHRDGLAPYVGLGLGASWGSDDTYPLPGDGRVYLSPELGIHFGRDGVLRPGVQLGLEGEVFGDGSPPRIQGVAAWTIW